MSKIVLITGGSRGIGAACARVLAADGYVVVVSYASNSQGAADVVAGILTAGGRAMAVKADISNRTAVKEMFRAVDQKLGPVTYLVNNVGVIVQRGRFDEMRQDTIDTMIDVNVKGYIYPTLEAIKRMSMKYGGKGGAIVNISSGSAHRGLPNNSVLYAMTKSAVNSMTIGLSQELAKEGIRVNTVAPRLIVTDMSGPEELAGSASPLLIGRAGEADEIAQGVKYLLSGEADYINGTKLGIASGVT